MSATAGVSSLIVYYLRARVNETSFPKFANFPTQKEERISVNFSFLKNCCFSGVAESARSHISRDSNGLSSGCLKQPLLITIVTCFVINYCNR